MTSTEAQRVLREVFQEKSEIKSWISYWASDPLLLRSFGSMRIAKLMPDHMLVAFTIGQTEHGKKLKLCRAISAVLELEGLTEIPVRSTSTSRKAIYQGFSLGGCDADRLRRTILRIQGALVGIIAVNESEHAR